MAKPTSGRRLASHERVAVARGVDVTLPVAKPNRPPTKIAVEKDRTRTLLSVGILDAQSLHDFWDHVAALTSRRRVSRSNRKSAAAATIARRNKATRNDLTIKAAIATERRRNPEGSKHAIATRVARRLGVSVSTVKRRF